MLAGLQDIARTKRSNGISGLAAVGIQAERLPARVDVLALAGLGAPAEERAILAAVAAGGVVKGPSRDAASGSSRRGGVVQRTAPRGIIRRRVVDHK